MLSSRPYMRDLGGDSPRLTVVGWVMVVLIGVYIIQSVCAFWFGWGGFTQALGAQPAEIAQGKVWKLLTYSLLHDVQPGQLLHIFLNLLMLFWVGRAVLDETGTRRWLWIYGTSALMGSVAFTLLHLALGNTGTTLLGASAAIYGLLGFITTLQPERPVTLFFVELQQRWVAAIFAGIAVFGLILWEVPGAGNVAHSAHLAGMFAGFLCARYHWFSDAFGSLQMPAWWGRRKALERTTSHYSVNVTEAVREPADDSKSLLAEVDRILDKIHSKGFQSLTDAEKATLDKAKDVLSRR